MGNSASGTLLSCIAVLGAAASISGTTAQQPRPADTGLVMGRVLDAGTRQPVPQATVSLSGTAVSRVLADAEGRFVFFDLPAGGYGLTASSPGYHFGELGRDWPGANGQPIELEDGARVRDLVVLLWKPGRVSGYVSDEAGEPVVGAQVQAWSVQHRAGRRWVVTRPPSIVRTDDRGLYRINDLYPGQTYAIVVHSSSLSLPLSTSTGEGRGGRGGAAIAETFFTRGLPSPVPGTAGTLSHGEHLVVLAGPGTAPPFEASGNRAAYRTTWFPNSTTLEEATLITIDSGSSRSDVNFQLMPAPAVRVSGTVTGPSGPAANVLLRLTAATPDDVAMELEAALTASDAAGRFSFFDVPPGRYVLDALELPRSADGFGGFRAASPNAPMVAFVSVSPTTTDPTYWTAQSLVVGNQSIANLAGTLRTGAQLRGRVAFRGAAKPPVGAALARIRLTIEPANGSSIGRVSFTPGAIDDKGVFQTVGLPANRYFVRADAPAGWTFEEALFEGRNLAESPIDLQSDADGIVLTFTDTPAVLSGTVKTAAGQPDTDAVVLIFPEDRRSWIDFGASPRTLRRLRVSRLGTYTTSGLPPGSYAVVARHGAEVGDWMHEGFLSGVAPSAQIVRIARGEKRVLDLVRSGRR